MCFSIFRHSLDLDRFPRIVIKIKGSKLNAEIMGQQIIFALTILLVIPNGIWIMTAMDWIWFSCVPSNKCSRE